MRNPARMRAQRANRTERSEHTDHSNQINSKPPTIPTHFSLPLHKPYIMKKFLTLALALLALSCTHREKLNSAHSDAQHEAARISLNDGQKWSVNPEMKPYVSNGRELVNSFLEGNQSDYATLAEKLQEQNQLLIKSCTMKGESHDELHKWLHPHLEMTDALADADAASAREIALQLQHSYELYGEYFN